MCKNEKIKEMFLLDWNFFQKDLDENTSKESNGTDKNVNLYIQYGAFDLQQNTICKKIESLKRKFNFPSRFYLKTWKLLSNIHSKYLKPAQKRDLTFFDRNHQVGKDIRNCFANFNFEDWNSLINLIICIKI